MKGRGEIGRQLIEVCRDAHATLPATRCPRASRLEVRDEPRDRLASSTDQDLLTVLSSLDQPGEVRLRLVDVDHHCGLSLVQSCPRDTMTARRAGTATKSAPGVFHLMP